MNKIILILTKLIDLVLAKLGRGSSLPGLLAMKFKPDILKYFKLPEKTIFVTATNGKTTTANMITQALEANNFKVVNNSKGANLETGIISVLLRNANFKGQVKADFLVIEIDEQTIPSVFTKITPAYLVINNFFRDQLDRYGEIDTLLNKISESLNNKTIVIGNGNDPLVVKMLKNHPSKLFYEMIKTPYSVATTNQTRESKFCPNCQRKLSYNYYHYAQIGHFNCQCGFKVPATKWQASNIDLKNYEMTINNYQIHTKYQNLYNYFNIIPTFAILDMYNLVNHKSLKAIQQFELNDGRSENYQINKSTVTLNLVKNPVGMNENINHLARIKANEIELLIVLNNFAADSQDTSWIYDCDFEKLNELGIKRIICSGKRAYDIANALQYATICKNKIIVEENINEAVHKFNLQTTNEQKFIFSTYTALQIVRKKLKELANANN